MLDGTLHAGLWLGVIFGIEFAMIYHGLLLTSASRAAVFLYTAPFFVAPNDSDNSRVQITSQASAV